MVLWGLRLGRNFVGIDIKNEFPDIGGKDRNSSQMTRVLRSSSSRQAWDTWPCQRADHIYNDSMVNMVLRMSCNSNIVGAYMAYYKLGMLSS